MANSNASALVLSSEASTHANRAVVNTNSSQPPSQLHSSLDGPVAILWDIENCPVPSDVRPEDVAGNIRMALRVHPIIKGAVTTFSAYGDFNAFPRRLREGCQRTGVKLVDVPNGRKDAADKAILIDMFLFALDNRPPSSIMLISGDVDFAPALHILGQRGYTVILVIPSGVGVSSALSNAGRFVWDWPSVVRGEGFVPPKTFGPLRGGATDVSGYLMGYQINENPDCQTEEEAIVYRGISQSYYNSRDFSVMAQSLSEYNTVAVSGPYFSTTSRSHSLPSGLNEVSAGPVASNEHNDLMWVQPGDLTGLKGQLVKMLEMSGGYMPLTRVPAEYHRMFGRPLYVSEYGSLKLVNLFGKMADKISVEGKGQKRMVCLREFGLRAVTNDMQSDVATNDKKGKGIREENNDVIVGMGSSDEFSDDDRIVKEHDEQRGKDTVGLGMTNQSRIADQNLEQLKYELQEILVSYSCRIFLGCFEAIYKQRYKKPLDYRRFGINELEELFDKLSDIVVVHEEPASKKKFLVALNS